MLSIGARILTRASTSGVSSRKTFVQRTRLYTNDKVEENASQEEATEEPSSNGTYSEVISRELAKARKRLQKGELKEGEYDEYVDQKFTEARNHFIEKAQSDKKYDGRVYTVKRPD